MAPQSRLHGGLRHCAGAGPWANILIFALASEYLLKPLPLADPDRVIRAYTGRSSNTVYTDYLAYRARTRTLSGLGAFQLASTSIRASDRPERVTGMAVSGNYFETVGVQAALGRAITIADDRPEAPGVAVISDNSWKRRFAYRLGLPGAPCWPPGPAWCAGRRRC